MNSPNQIYYLKRMTICTTLLLSPPFLPQIIRGKEKRKSTKGGDFTANVDWLKMVPVEILLNFGNYFRTLQLGFWKFLSGIVFFHYYVRTIGLSFSQAHLIWPKPRAFNPDRKSMGTPTFYCDICDSSD